MYLNTADTESVCVTGHCSLTQATIETVVQRKEALRKMEDLGAQVEEALIFDNKWVTTLPHPLIY